MVLGCRLGLNHDIKLHVSVDPVTAENQASTSLSSCQILGRIRQLFAVGFILTAPDASGS